MAINDKSKPVEVGKILYKHIAPQAFMPSHCELMQSINGKVDKSKLNKVKVNNQPKGIIICFYSGPVVAQEGYKNLIKKLENKKS